jgi:hypothetical protein
LLLALGEEAVSLVERGLAFVQGAEELGLLLFGKLLLLLFFRVGLSRGLAAAAGEKRGARYRDGDREEFHTHMLGCAEGWINSKII